MVLLLVIGFLAGVVTAISPCVLPVLPILLAGGASGGRRRPYAIIAGLVLSFTVFTLTAAWIVDKLGLPDDFLRNAALPRRVGRGLPPRPEPRARVRPLRRADLQLRRRARRERAPEHEGGAPDRRVLARRRRPDAARRARRPRHRGKAARPARPPGARGRHGSRGRRDRLQHRHEGPDRAR